MLNELNSEIEREFVAVCAHHDELTEKYAALSKAMRDVCDFL